jgi:hypothetical protein
MDSTEILQIQKSLIIGSSILGFVSLLGCLTIIFLFITRPYLRDLIFKLTFFLAISEIINIIAYFMSLNFLNLEQDKIYDSKICVIQPIFITFANTSSLLWILMICYCIHDLFVNKNRNYDKNKNKFLFIGYVLPIIPTLL